MRGTWGTQGFCLDYEILWTQHKMDAALNPTAWPAQQSNSGRVMRSYSLPCPSRQALMNFQWM